MKKSVFLDRDGVINKVYIKDGLPRSPNSSNELKILPGVRESIIKLKKLNFICLMVTNQPNVSRKKIDKKLSARNPDILISKSTDSKILIGKPWKSLEILKIQSKINAKNDLSVPNSTGQRKKQTSITPANFSGECPAI